jgi:hypothetical protein
MNRYKLWKSNRLFRWYKKRAKKIWNKTDPTPPGKRPNTSFVLFIMSEIRRTIGAFFNNNNNNKQDIDTLDFNDLM